MSEFGRVTVTTKLGKQSYIMTDFQSEQLDYDRSGDRIQRSQTQKYADYIKHSRISTCLYIVRWKESMAVMKVFGYYNKIEIRFVTS